MGHLRGSFVVAPVYDEISDPSDGLFLVGKDDKYGFIIPPKEVEITPSNLIEVEVMGSEITKVVVRIDYNSKFDLIVVFILFVKLLFIYFS